MKTKLYAMYNSSFVYFIARNKFLLNDLMNICVINYIYFIEDTFSLQFKIILTAVFNKRPSVFIAITCTQTTRSQIMMISDRCHQKFIKRQAIIVRRSAFKLVNVLICLTIISSLA